MNPPAVPRLNAALEGRYRIERELGEGGMATVYLAEDLKHERKVALKVLKPELAAVVGAERFLAEIKTTANLQHPHILPLFDSGQAGSFLFYVMPYIEGESLRERLDRDKQLPVDEAVRIATDVAEALHSAHEQGVIHRDIKPANILMSKGRPLVADFGIALAVSQAGGGRLTETGLSMGTPYYMSPEQASADREPSAASDVYSLGCVLFEMLVGEPPYVGSSAQAVLAKILMGDAPAATAARPSIPANVDAAIAKALEKLPADRFHMARDFARALTDEAFRHGKPEAGVGVVASAGPWKRLSIVTSVLAIIAIVIAGFSLASSSGVLPSPVVRFTVPVGEETDIHLGGEYDARFGRPALTSLALSPQGTRLVYSAWSQSPEGNPVSNLYERSLEHERAVPIGGTEGGAGPFFSPEGDWIGFMAGRSIRRVSPDGGNVETVVESGALWGATWGDNGSIVYVGDDGLYKVPATGGEGALVAARDEVQPGFTYRQPHMLPGSGTLLFAGGPFTQDLTQFGVFALDLETGERTSLLPNAMDPHYVDTGHLLFIRQGNLMAVGFDPDQVAVRGQPVIVLEDVMQAVGMPNATHESGDGQVAISASGHLAYVGGGVFPLRRRMIVRTRSDGNAEALDVDPRQFISVRASPQGEQLTFSAQIGRATNVYVHDLDRRVTERLNTGGFTSGTPEWGPSGRLIAFRSDREDGVSNIYRMAADGSTEPERLAPSEQAQAMMSWSSAGVIAYLQDDDIWTLPPDGEPTLFFASAATESHVTFSPDGRWLAYQSSQSGRSEVFVRPYPGPGPATLVSDDGGASPAWSRDGTQIYFGRSGRLVVKDVLPGDEFRVGPARTFIDARPYGYTVPQRNYDVLADGSVIGPVDERDFTGAAGAGLGTRQRYMVDRIHLVLNFFEELKTRVPN